MCAANLWVSDTDMDTDMAGTETGTDADTDMYDSQQHSIVD